MENPALFDEYEMNNTSDLHAFEELNLQCLSAESYSYCPEKHLQTSTWNSYSSPAPSSFSSKIISFAPPDSKIEPKTEICCPENTSFSPAFVAGGHFLSENYARKYERNRRSVSRNPLHAMDHVIAERKRREKLSQRFIALSANLPGLKKTDKASVLANAVKYIKQLQEQAKTLEEKVRKGSIESAVLIKKSHISDCEHTLSSDKNQHRFSDQKLPEIEVKISEKDVLIRIHCEKHEGLFAKLLVEVEKLNLSISNSSVFPFGDLTLYMTFVAKMDKKISTKASDLVKKLQKALAKFVLHA